MTTAKDPIAPGDSGQAFTSLSTQAARNLATTTKSAPMMQAITPRWLLRVLPWVPVSAGVYRLNRRLSYALGDGVISFTSVGSSARIIPQELGELPILSGFDDTDVLELLTDRFVQSEHSAGDIIARADEPADRVLVIAQGKATKSKPGKYGDTLDLGVLAEGDHAGDRALISPSETWDFTIRAETACTVLSLKRQAFLDVVSESEALKAHLEAIKDRTSKPQDRHGQAAILLSAGHKGEPALPSAFVDYERRPREYELHVAQTILNIHTRVADLYNGPMDQTKEQLRLTIHALKEQMEHEILNNEEIGLLHNVDPKQRLQTKEGPPAPGDMDELLCRRRKTQYFLAHPRAIAALGRECNRLGLYPEPVLFDGKPVHAWRGVPLLPCPKIPISDVQTTTILAMRTGEENQGVIGLRPASLPEEVEPGLNVRFMGINERAVLRYLVSAYYSVVPLIPDAFGALENVEIGR